MNSPSATLTLALEDRLTAGFLADQPGSRLLIRGVEYLDAGRGDVVGFYDWLRDVDGRLLGVRLWADGDSRSVVREPASLPYVRTVPGHQIEVFFVESERDIDDVNSASQSFLLSKVFRSADRHYALVFDLTELDAADRDRLKRIPLHAVST